MDRPNTAATYYQERITEAVSNIENTWRLEQILKFIRNINKED